MTYQASPARYNAMPYRFCGKSGLKLPAIFVESAEHGLMEQQQHIIAALAGLDENRLSFHAAPFPRPDGHVALVVGSLEIYLPLAGMVDVSEERQRLEKELAEAQAQIERLQSLLSSPFAEKAPAAVVQKEREKLAAFEGNAARLRSQLAALE